MAKKIELSPKQRGFLKSKAHDLEPKLQIGKNGLTDSFVKELVAALERDELVKVRVGKFVDEALVTEAAEKANASLVGELGRTALYYRRAKPPVIELPPRE